MIIINYQGKNYRADIDGLRAVAVLAVILFHINPAWIPGGFVGVDIFFVISGYLITGHIIDDLRQNKFSLQMFYQRRIKRILPAVWAMLIICVPVSWFLMLPSDAEPMAKSALWSMIGLPNVYFWREVTTDYFAPQSSQMPFLHLWSLGVEEQFYLFWPLLLIFFWRIRPKNASKYSASFALFLVIASPFLAEYLIANQAGRFAYYMLPTRAGELASGALLAIHGPYFAKYINTKIKWSYFLACIGWLLLAFSFIFLSEHQPFPGFRSLVPTIGAVALIASGGSFSSHKLILPLTLPLMQWMGRCSFSAYLWHWPILAWWRYLWGEPSLYEGIVLLGAVIFISGVSQRWVESPARLSKLVGLPMLARYLLIPSVVIAGMSLAVARAEQWNIPIYSNSLFSGLDELASYRKPVHQLPWVCQQHVLDPSTLTSSRCEFGEGTGPSSILLFGDSHAAQFAPVIRLAAEIQGVRVRSVALGACAPLPGSLKGVVSDSRLDACEDGMEQIFKRADDFAILIIGGAWTSYAKNDPEVWQRFEEYLTSAVGRGKRVLLLPRVPEVAGYDAKCVAKRFRTGNWLDCPDKLPLKETSNDTNANLLSISQRVPGVEFLNFDVGLCNNVLCDVINKDGLVLYSDGSHLGAYGSLQLASDLQAQGALPSLGNPVVRTRRLGDEGKTGVLSD